MTKSIAPALIVFGLLPAAPVQAQLASSEQEFQQLAAALKADDAERQSAIATCIEQGIGANPNPAGMAQFMEVPLEKAWETWCTRMTNGIASGRLSLADIDALNDGTVTANAEKVLTTISEWK